MGTPQITAPPRAQPGSPGSSGPSGSPGSPGSPRDVTPTSGVIHVNTRHSSGFTVIGNHLAQHHELSLVAIGLAVHIQSLPTGAKIGIKTLTDRFPESEARIAAALRELEAKGYLHRSRVRLPEGRVVTRTISYNQPGTTTTATASATAAPQPRARRSDTPAPPPVQPPPPPRETAPEPEPTPAPAPAPAPATELEEVQTPTTPAQAPTPAQTTPNSPPPPPLPPSAPALPQQRTPAEGLRRTAAALLADLRREAPVLTLSENDIHALTPGVTTWLERHAHPDTIRHALTADLPAPLKHPAKLLRHRITTRLPPPLPGTADLTAPRRKVALIPLQNCDTCERAFRAAEPGHCRDCRTEHADVIHNTTA